MNLNRLLAHKATIPVLAGVAGVVNGGVVGYLLGKREATIEIVVAEDEVIDTMNVALPFGEEHHLPEAISFDRPPSKVVITPEKAAEIEAETYVRENPESSVTKAAIAAVLGRATVMPNDDEGNAQIKIELNDAGREVVTDVENEYDEKLQGLRTSIFAKPHEEWDYEKEVATRGDRDPYVITDEEFHGEESGYRQTSFTYYAGDDHVVSEDGAPLINWQDVLGSELKFGYGSKAHDIVFVRNPRLEMEYEVIRNYDSFAHAVMGAEAEDELDEEIVHSMHPVRRTREE